MYKPLTLTYFSLNGYDLSLTIHCRAQKTYIECMENVFCTCGTFHTMNVTEFLHFQRQTHQSICAEGNMSLLYTIMHLLWTFSSSLYCPFEIYFFNSNSTFCYFKKRKKERKKERKEGRKKERKHPPAHTHAPNKIIAEYPSHLYGPSSVVLLYIYRSYPLYW